MASTTQSPCEDEDPSRPPTDAEANHALRVINADCMRAMPRLPDGIAQLVLTDPPYGINYQSRNKSSKPIANDDRPFIWWMREAYRITSQGGGMLCFCRWDVQEAFNFAAECAGWRLRSQVIWDKGRHTMGDCKTQFGAQHEVIWWAVKGKFAFPGGRPMSVLKCASPHHTKRTHPTKKPTALLAQLIEKTTREGDLIVDPFCGTGATLVAARNLRRRAIGIELDETYARIARYRARNEQLPDLDPPSP